MAYRTRKFQRQSDHGIDDWLMTYADMITLLLCFFIVILSVSVPKSELFREARQKVLEQFSVPGKDLIVLPLPDSSAPDKPAVLDALPALVGKMEKPTEGQKKDYEKAPEGDRLVTLEMPSATFFESGSAVLSENGQKTLSDIIESKIKSPLYADYAITIEGHTDDVPIKTAQFPSNWELSTGRAAAVVRFMIEHGVAAEKLRAAGYADSHPKLPNRDSAGKAIPNNQGQNRRVLIKLEKIEKREKSSQ